jgi:patatin-like phospholipase/acyl hydrolase
MSFDGGGIRAIIPAAILHALIRRFPDLVSDTDLLAGSSTGAFIVLALASGKSTSEVVELFSLENARKIFAHPKNPPLKRPKYENYNLIEFLAGVFPSDLRLNDLDHRVVIPAFRLIGPQGEPWRPVFFNNFPSSPTRFERVLDVALASCAAPVYFPSYHNFIDGGMVVNNPSTAAVSFAVNQFAGGQNIKKVALFSFGTGYNPHKITDDTTKWGILKWINPFPCSDEQPSVPLLTVAMEGVLDADTFFTESFLQKRFFRLNPKLDEDTPLDEYEKIPELTSIAYAVDLDPAINYLASFWP